MTDKERKYLSDILVIRTDKEYKAVTTIIESLLEKATGKGGFHELAKDEAAMLSRLSKMAEDYEDNTLMLMYY